MRCPNQFAAFWQVTSLAIALTGARSAGARAVSGNDDRGFQLVRKYLDSAQTREAATRGVEMTEEIEAKVPKLRLGGTLRALRRVSCTGQITYHKLDSSGDARVNREVITRYLSAESEPRDPGIAAITPANYEFWLKAVLDWEGRLAYVFRLKPRTKRVGLFKGELWIDAATGMPLREAGQFVKVPSIFLKRIRFIRDYEIRGGVSVPKSIESTVETRLAGRAELRVRFGSLTYESSCCRDAHALFEEEVDVVTNVDGR